MPSLLDQADGCLSDWNDGWVIYENHARVVQNDQKTDLFMHRKLAIIHVLRKDDIYEITTTKYETRNDHAAGSCALRTYSISTTTATAISSTK